MCSAVSQALLNQSRCYGLPAGPNQHSPNPVKKFKKPSGAYVRVLTGLPQHQQNLDAGLLQMRSPQTVHQAPNETKTQQSCP